MAGVQDELWKAVIFLISRSCLDLPAARLLHNYVFALFGTSEISFVFISMPRAQK